LIVVCVLFAVPFDEDQRDAEVWFLDHDYLEQMYGMFKKVNGICHLWLLYYKLLNCLKVDVSVHHLM